jgi:hypothetical protein
MQGTSLQRSRSHDLTFLRYNFTYHETGLCFLVFGNVETRLIFLNTAAAPWERNAPVKTLPAVTEYTFVGCRLQGVHGHLSR